MRQQRLYSGTLDGVVMGDIIEMVFLQVMSAYCPTCDVCISWNASVRGHIQEEAPPHVLECLHVHRDCCMGEWEIKKEK